MPNPLESTPKRFHCRHIFADGHRCGSPALRTHELCFYHHTSRPPAASTRARRGRQTSFDLPLSDPTDRTAVQTSIGFVLRRIAANEIDPRRAGLLLYGLQIASLNLPRQAPAPLLPAGEIVEEITTDPDLGHLAPAAEFLTLEPEQPFSLARHLLEQIRTSREQAQQDAATEGTPTTLPTLQAATAPACHHLHRPPTPPTTIPAHPQPHLNPPSKTCHSERSERTPVLRPFPRCSPLPVLQGARLNPSPAKTSPAGRASCADSGHFVTCIGLRVALTRFGNSIPSRPNIASPTRHRRNNIRA